MKYILIILFASFGLSGIFSQEAKDPYLLPEFTVGLVYYKDGRVFRVPLNYNLLMNKFYFIDSDQEKKEFSDPGKVVSIRIGNRTFRPVDGNEIGEVIQADPKILVRYKGTKKVKKDLTYGGKTETASVDSYSNLIYGTGDNTSNTSLGNVEIDFYLETGNRLKRFATPKQFLKLFPEQKEALKRYMDKHNTDFRSCNAVVQLCNHAVAISRK